MINLYLYLLLILRETYMSNIVASIIIASAILIHGFNIDIDVIVKDDKLIIEKDD